MINLNPERSQDRQKLKEKKIIKQNSNIVYIEKRQKKEGRVFLLKREDKMKETYLFLYILQFSIKKNIKVVKT